MKKRKKRVLKKWCKDALINMAGAVFIYLFIMFMNVIYALMFL